MRAGESVDFETMLMWTPAAPFAAFAAMAFAGDRRARWLPVAGMLLGALLMGWALPLGPGISAAEEENAGPTGEVAFRSLMLIVVGMLLGMYGAARKRVLRALTERADRAERERYMLAEQARAEERARLAAEMHDVVTHRVSLMVLQAGALRVTSQDESVHAAAEALRATGCQALEELRDVVGLLRRDDGADADAGAAPGAPDAAGDGGGTGERASVPGLSELIAESESVGVAAELTEEGDPPLASPVIGRTAYRIVQEALTNVRKHAPGARVEVRVRYRPDGVRLSVRNSATDRPADSLLSAVGSGMGLTGLRQRVELIGGTLTAGPDGGGFHVQAELPAYVPTTAAPAEPAPLRA
ncbi:two-component sensor histidine kinase [Streptomyces armeniacus]|uniref:histidine kinase n=2 Tax=Streptomyces armeniacus TaxID=83291 RepID=A0A345Y074_9ACTN|nr:two-component sensor histidine kinase [Streptomyces armeniacus]